MTVKLSSTKLDPAAINMIRWAQVNRRVHHGKTVALTIERMMDALADNPEMLAELRAKLDEMDPQ